MRESGAARPVALELKAKPTVNHPPTYGCYHVAISAQDFRWRMLRNGSYSAWFRTSLREGTGIVELNDGKVTGGDPAFAYSGSYFQNGDKFSASLTTRRHTQGQPSVFDIDNVDLTVTGKSTPTTAACTGTAKQAPGLAFEAIFVRIADEPSNAAPQASRR